MQPIPGQSEPPWDRGPRLLTPATGALGLLAVYVVSAYFAYRALGPFPDPIAFWTLLTMTSLAAAGGAFVGAIEPSDRRGPATAVAIGLAAAVPFAATAWLPGVAQPDQHPLPGGIDVVIAAEPDGNLDLYMIPEGDPRRTYALTETPTLRERFPELSPDGRSVVYAVDGSDGSTDLHVMSLDGDGRPAGTRLLLDGPDNLNETSWSPDGRTLLVRSDTEDRADVYRYDVASGDLVPFLENVFNVRWSPDGTAIAFSAYRRSDPGNADLFVADADGSNRRHVVDTGFDDFFPVWSPEGDRLAFASEVHDGDLDVFVVGIDGSGLAILTADHDGRDEPLLWGPEGDIVFLSDRDDLGGVFSYLMEPDGSDVRLFSRL